MEHRIAIAGFGNVGQAVARLIADEHASAEGIAITGVSDPRFGTVASETPLDAAALLAGAESGAFSEVAGLIDGGVFEMLEASGADTLVELTYTDLETGEPATSHLMAALERGMNVSTTNKGPIALHLTELLEVARANGAILAFEGTVMSGSPAVELAQSLQGAGYSGLTGILNGTTNYIITRMEDGVAYQDALAEAQERGYAEADPSGDVEGHDVAAKLSILARVLAGEPMRVSQIDRVPLAAIDPGDLAEAAGRGERWRYVGILEVEDGAWRAGVAPKSIPETHPLASIRGATNAITFHTGLLGDVTLSGPGAGRAETAYAVIADLRRIEKAVGR